MKHGHVERPVRSQCIWQFSQSIWHSTDWSQLSLQSAWPDGAARDDEVCAHVLPFARTDGFGEHVRLQDCVCVSAREGTRNRVYSRHDNWRQHCGNCGIDHAESSTAPHVRATECPPGPH
jgi:hypothetical protein